MTRISPEQPTLLEGLNSFQEFGGILADIDQKYSRCDFTEPLEAFIPVLEQIHEDHWSQRMSPSGSKWPALAESTIKKKGHDQPLVLTSALYAAMTSITAEHHIGGVSHRGLIYGTDLEYAHFHQDGTQRIPQREFAGMNEETCQYLVDLIADHLIDSLKYTVRG